MFFLFTTVDDVNITYPGDRAAEADQLFTVQFICPSERMDNLCYGHPSDGVAFVMSELVVVNDGSVFVFSLSSSEVHDHLHL